VLRGRCHHDALRKMLADNAVPFINVGIYRPDRPTPASAPTMRLRPTAPPRMSLNSTHVRIGVVSALQRNNDRASARVRRLRRALAEAHRTAG